MTFIMSGPLTMFAAVSLIDILDFHVAVPLFHECKLRLLEFTPMSYYLLEHWANRRMTDLVCCTIRELGKHLCAFDD